MIPFTFNAYIVLVSGIYIMSVSGTIYLFGVYSESLRHALNYDDQEIQLIGTLTNAGTWFGIVGGLFYDNFGPRLTALGACVLSFLGYFLLYLAVTGHIAQAATHPALVGCFGFLLGQGSGWGYTVALNTNGANFAAQDRGTVVGLLVCFFGLCAGIYTQFYLSFFQDQVGQFFLFMALMMLGVYFIFGFVFTNQLPTVEPLSVRKKACCYIIGIVMAVYLGVSNSLRISLNVAALYFIIPVLVLFFCFLLILYGTELVRFTSSPEILSDSIQSETTILIQEDTPNPKTNQGLNLIESLLQVEFWLISFIFFCVIGSGIVSIDHFSDLVLSRLPNMSIGNDTDSNGTFVNPAHIPEINYLVILFAVFNALGRMAIGYFSDILSNKMIRADWLIVTSSLMCIVQIYFIFATPKMLYFGVILLGVAYGGTFCILPTLVSEVFGLAHFGANFGFIGTAPALGSYLFSTLLGGKLLDHFEMYDRICVGANKKHCQSHCYGDICFRYVYITLAGVCGLSLVCSFLLRFLLRDGFVPKRYFTKQTTEYVT